MEADLVDNKGQDEKRSGLSRDVYDNKWVIHKFVPGCLLFSTG